MQRLNSYRMRLVLVGFVAGIVFGSGRVDADFTFGEPTNLPAYLANSSSSSYYGDDLCVSAFFSSAPRVLADRVGTIYGVRLGQALVMTGTHL